MYVRQPFKLVDKLESYMDQYYASTQPAFDDFLSSSYVTHITKAFAHIRRMDYILYAWFPEIVDLRISAEWTTSFMPGFPR